MSLKTLGSLFSGIGGLELGLERSGMRTEWQVESDPYARNVLAKHWPDVERFKDVRECGKRNLRRVDVICGGFPCQDISYAGKGAGIEGERSGLWSEFARIVSELRPDYVVVENVPALLSRGLGRVLGDLAESGYDAEWDCISARSLGALHVRNRVFVVGYRPNPGGNGLQRGVLDPGTTWSEQQFKGLVSNQLRLSVSAGSRGRISDGIPKRMDRLRCLGNAVVPQVAEYIGGWING